MERGTALMEDQDIVEVAKAIRKELKEKFPATKFKVRTRRFSLGEAIDVNWENGVSSKKVNEVLSKFERIDTDPRTGEILGGGNRYIHGQRIVSEEIYKREAKAFKERFVEGTFGEWNLDPNLRTQVFRKVYESDYPEDL